MVVVTGTINSCNYATNLSTTPTSGVALIALGAAAPQFGTVVVAGGGTGLTTLTSHALIVGAATSNVTLVGPSSTSGQVLQSAGTSADPAYSTATYPSTTTVNQILYSSSSNVIAGLATANTSALTTGAGGIPGFTAYTSLNTASTLVSRDSNGNSYFNNVGTSLVTFSSGTTSLTVATPRHVILTASATGITLPDATTLIAGTQFEVNNNTASSVVINKNGGSLLANAPSSSYITIYLTDNSTSAGTWDYHWLFPSSSTNGQLMIGSGTANWSAATLTAGTGISITNGSNSITIASSGSANSWTDEPVSFTAVSGNGYFITGGATATLPASPSQGDQIEFVVDTTNMFTIQAAIGQEIRIGSAVSGVAGNAANNSRGDAVTLVYRNANTTWIAKEGVVGTWIVT